LKALSSGLSIFLWGLVAAKAKTGFTAATTKDKDTVSYSFKKMVSLLLVLAFATLAKMNADHSFIDSILNPTDQLQTGRMLK